MMRNHRVDHHHGRRGATILEVIFAIGVLLFGLVGIAAVIPAAGKLARNSVDFSRGSAMGVSIASGFESMNLNVRSSWASFNTGSPGSVPSGSLCLDPIFVSRPVNRLVFPDNAFQLEVFPYYKDLYNPLADPRANSSLTLATGNLRVPRASLFARKIGQNGALINDVMTAQAAARIFDDRDQLTFAQPDDKTLPVGQVFRNGQDGRHNNPTFFPGSRGANPNYSWFATIQQHSNSHLATVNVVVIKNRERTFFAPDATATLPLDLTERLALVTSSTHFVGGGGGTIDVQATNVVSNQISDGSWLMLIKNPTGLPQRAEHAWFRVVQSSADPIINGSTWQRSVTLEGPDWSFNASTLAVLVKDVVSVIEFPIRIRQ